MPRDARSATVARARRACSEAVVRVPVACRSQVAGRAASRRQARRTRSELLAFHSRYYSALIMQLCCLDAEPLETLEKWVSDAFAAAPNLNIERPTAATALPPMAPGALPLAPLAQGGPTALGAVVPAAPAERRRRVCATDRLLSSARPPRCL